MTKAEQTITFFILIASLYLAAFLHIIPLDATTQNEVVPVLPLWSVVSFGAFMLFRLGWGVFTFHDVPQAHAELMGEIQSAKKFLQQQGIDVE